MVVDQLLKIHESHNGHLLLSPRPICVCVSGAGPAVARSVSG